MYKRQGGVSGVSGLGGGTGGPPPGATADNNDARDDDWWALRKKNPGDYESRRTVVEENLPGPIPL